MALPVQGDPCSLLQNVYIPASGPVTAELYPQLGAPINWPAIASLGKVVEFSTTVGALSASLSQNALQSGISGSEHLIQFLSGGGVANAVSTYTGTAPTGYALPNFKTLQDTLLYTTATNTNYPYVPPTSGRTYTGKSIVDRLAAKGGETAYTFPTTGEALVSSANIYDGGDFDTGTGALKSCLYCWKLNERWTSSYTKPDLQH